MSYNNWALSPLMSTLCLPDVMHVTISPRPPPSIFAYCKRLKTEGGNGLGMRLTLIKLASYMYMCCCVICTTRFPRTPMQCTCLGIAWFQDYDVACWNMEVHTSYSSSACFNPLSPEYFSLQINFSLYMPLTHHISTSVQALTPKLNPTPLPALASRPVMLTTPTH